MKNKIKFDLKKISFYDKVDKKQNTRTIKIFYDSELVGEDTITTTISDALLKWLEKEYKELPKKEQVVVKKEKEKIVLPDIPDVDKVLKKRGRKKKETSES